MLAATCIPTSLERRCPLQVDALVPEPIFASTHAITIDAPPEQVWPWIAQMGAGRAGWYSWDAIDNGGAPSSTRIIPELQSVARGDIMPETEAEVSVAENRVESSSKTLPKSLQDPKALLQRIKGKKENRSSKIVPIPSSHFAEVGEELARAARSVQPATSRNSGRTH